MNIISLCFDSSPTALIFVTSLVVILIAQLWRVFGPQKTRTLDYGFSHSSSTIHFKEKYDVFLSFRGTDTRKTFTSHLYKALNDGKKIETYIDYRLERGDEIAPALLKAIEGSKISVIIFSKDYASSRWCLDELVHILECKEMNGQHVVPIFYQVDPSHVRHQRGSYDLEERFKNRPEIERLKWKGALTKAANLSGFDSASSTIRDESDLIDQVVKDIFKKLNYESSVELTGFVGVERRIQQIESLLCLVPQDDRVHSVGIWGMGGIGKTTLADLVFHRLSSQFKAHCFLANVREASGTREGLYDMRNKLIRKLLGDESLNIDTPTLDSFTKVKLRRTKVLVVLDDVNDLSQLEFLAGRQVPFGPGSRIIITTRDIQQLGGMKVLREGAKHDVNIYKVEKLDHDEACQLFHLNAPRDICSAADYKEYLIKMVDYAAGIPLALEILCSLWHNISWNDIKKSLDEKLQCVYRASYDSLAKDEKEIFLDIACFHKGKHINDAKRRLDACGLSADIGIKVLVEMSLISTKDNHLLMHDVIQEMGWDIVRQQCPEEPGKRTRLHTNEDVRHVLEKNTGTATIQRISSVNFFPLLINMAPEVFEKMYNLRYLHVFVLNSSQLLSHQAGLTSLPDSLRFLGWHHYPWKSLPSMFSPTFLVELDMPRSNLLSLWNEGQTAPNLKRIDLSYSHQLIGVSYLTKALERINLEGCTNLAEVDLSECPNIVSVNLQFCKRLVQVPSYFQNLHKLAYLNLRGCTNINILSEIPTNMEFLDLAYTEIVNYPSSIWSLEKLVELNLCECKGIKNLLNSILMLNSLTLLNLSSTDIEELPSSIEYLPRVVTIKLQYCKSFVSISTSICKLKSLKELDLYRCSRFQYFPEILEPMECLEILRLSATGIVELHKSIENLVGLKSLDLEHCEDLESVSNGIDKLKLLENFSLRGCHRLNKLPDELTILWSLVLKLDLSDCRSLKEIPNGLMIGLTSLKELDLSRSRIESLPPSIKQASELRILHIEYCEHLQSLPELPCLLEKLVAIGCVNLKTVSRSMTTLTQGLDQICVPGLERHQERILFLDCLMLDENAKSSIMDDAHLRIMRMATAVSKPTAQIESLLPTVESYFSVTIICPGTEIPKWFSYQTEGSSITIRLPLSPSDAKLVDIALCAIVTAVPDDPDSLPKQKAFACALNLKTSIGESSEFILFRERMEMLANSDHVVVCYHAEWSTRLHNATEASFNFYSLFNPADEDIKVKRCGVCLFYAQGQDG